MSSKQGTIAITARGDGNRWYGRISIPLEAASEAHLKEGDRVSTRCQDCYIIIFPDEHGRIKLPPARGKSDRRHAFEAATATLGLRENRLPQMLAETTVIDGNVYVRIPDEFLAGEDQKKRRPRKKLVKSTPPSAAPKVIRQVQPSSRIWGAAAAIVTEATRANKQVRPMNLGQIVSLLKEKGSDLVIAGPRFFKLNGKSVTASDLQDEVNKVCGCTEQDRIVLVMD